MYEKEFKEIYEAIDLIYEESEYSGWQKIADEILEKVELLENKLKSQEITNEICNE